MSYNFQYPNDLPAGMGPPIPADPAPAAGPLPPPHTLLIDRLVQRHRLSAQQKGDLVGLYQIATRGPTALGHCDAMSRVYLLGCEFGSEKRIMDTINALERQGGGQRLQSLVDELSRRLEDSWSLTAEQKKNIRQVCQEQINLPGRTNFKMLALDVDALIRHKPTAYRLEHVVGRHNRETQLTAQIRAMSSNVRNMYRQELKRSLFGKKKRTVEKFVMDQVARYNLARSADGTQALLIQNVLLRRFAREHASLLDACQDESEDENSVQGDSEPASKRQKAGKGRGRVADGQDFWSKVDEWFEEKVAAWGSNYGCEGWTAFIDASIKQDHEFMEARKETGKTAQSTTVRVAPDVNGEDGSVSPVTSSGTGEFEENWFDGLDMEG